MFNKLFTIQSIIQYNNSKFNRLSFLFKVLLPPPPSTSNYKTITHDHVTPMISFHNSHKQQACCTRFQFSCEWATLSHSYCSSIWISSWLRVPFWDISTVIKKMLNWRFRILNRQFSILLIIHIFFSFFKFCHRKCVWASPFYHDWSASSKVSLCVVHQMRLG